MLLNRKEKVKLAIKLLHEGKTTREIAKLSHLSLSDIGLITKRITGDDYLADSDSDLAQDIKLKGKSHFAQSFQMFEEDKSLVGVSIELDLTPEEVQDYYSKYLVLTNRDELNDLSAVRTLFSAFSASISKNKRRKSQQTRYYRAIGKSN